jgi:FtsP/CotA-like multicopper oxidase with cupredoxin domain
MAHQEKADHMTITSARHPLRRRPVRLLSLLGLSGLAAVLVPISTTVASHAAGGASEGLICENQVGDVLNPNVVLTAKAGHILTPDNNSIYMWSYSFGNEPFQYPGATLCVTEGAKVTITLKNTLNVSTSIVFPGMEGVLADGVLSTPVATDSLTTPAAPGGTVTYTFDADQAGTYLYESGTNPQLQDQMGLVGALIVRPASFNPAAPHVYGTDLDTQYKPGKEFLNLFSELDPDLHQKVEFAVDQNAPGVNWKNYTSRYWMINGRVFPDTIGANNSLSLPSQPYSALVHIQPRDAGNLLPALVRMLNAGSRTYPFHPHGNHDKLIGVDARPLRGDEGADLTRDEFSRVMVPGQTSDVLVTWMDAQAFSDPGSDIGTVIPPDLARENGAYWSGTPYLGVKEAPRANATQFNECGEYYHMAHSHSLYQVATYSASGSGMLTFTRIDPPNDSKCHPAGA